MIARLSNLFRRPRLWRRRPRVDSHNGHGDISTSLPMGGLIEALHNNPNRTPIPIGMLSHRTAMQGRMRLQLAALGRYIYDNYGFASLAVDTIADYSCPILLQSASDDAGWNKAADEYFEEWAARADFTGRFTWETLQRIASKMIDTDCDVGVSVTLLGGIPQVVLLPCWRIGNGSIKEDSRLYDGVVLDQHGRVSGYVLDQGSKDETIIPANEMLLLFDPDRIEAYRGLSPIRRGSNDLRDRQDIKALEKIAVKVSSSLCAAIEGVVTTDDGWGGDDPESGFSGLEESPAGTGGKGLTLSQLLGGDIPVLLPGQKITQLENKRPGDRVGEFMRDLAEEFVAGLGLPPAFVLDTRLTGPNQRNVNGKAQRKFDSRQATIASMANFVRLRVLAHAIERKELPAVPGWWSCEWQGPPKVSIDDGKDSASWREDFGRGLMTRQNHFGNRQLDWRRETDQGLAEDEYILTKCSEIAQRTGVPIGLILARWGYTEAKAAPVANVNGGTDD